MNQRKREHNERAWLAWHIAALYRTKKLPKLEKLTAPRRERRRQTPDEMAAIARQWTAAVKGRRSRT